MAGASEKLRSGVSIRRWSLRWTASAEGAMVRRKDPERECHLAALLKEYLALGDPSDGLYRSWYDSAWNHVRAMAAAGDRSTMLMFCQVFLYDANEENALAMEILWGMQNGKYPLNTPHGGSAVSVLPEKAESDRARNIVPSSRGLRDFTVRSRRI